jgi:site-specific DNA-methyltransferase (adenine-specific)
MVILMLNNSVQLDNDQITLIHGDCLEVMPKMKPGIIDLILADLPYGATRNKWDSVIPLDKLWEQYKRIRKNNAAIVLTAQTPFDKVLGVSNLEELRYEWIWEKSNVSGFLNADDKPLRAHENVLVFYKEAGRYKPIKFECTPYTVTRNKKKDSNYGFEYEKQTVTYNSRFPLSIQFFNTERGKHPTQKPVALMEYLIKTYTNEGDLVLDNTMGSGTTAVACINSNRRFIGIELDKGYFDIAVDRCKKALYVE